MRLRLTITIDKSEFNNVNFSIKTEPRWKQFSDTLQKIQVRNFLKNYLNYESHPSNFKTCHFLGKFEAEKKQPPVMLKFIKFGEKSEI